MSITINPQTTIKLCTVPWGDTIKHTLLFDSKDKQDTYFNGLTGLTFNEFTYIRKDSAIKIGLNIDLIRNYNYLYYTNYDSNISDMGITKTPKTYYCFILGREYVNENTTKLYIKCDEIQTYMTEILSDTTSISYINRQHISKSEDNNQVYVKKYLLPENLETGEYIRTLQLDTTNIIGDVSSIEYPSTWTDIRKAEWGSLDYMIVAGCTESVLDNDYTTALNRMYGGIYNGLTYYGFRSDAMLSAFIAYLNSTAAISTLFNLFMVPISIGSWEPIYVVRKGYTYSTDDSGEETSADKSFDIKYFKLTSTSYKTLDTIHCGTWTRFLYTGNSGYTYNDNLDDSNSYLPHNKKLYTYPYCYLQLLNGESGAINLFFEYFNDWNNIDIDVIGTLSQGCSIVAYPKNYKGCASNFENILAGPKHPTCSWNTDSYTNWLTQTAVSRKNTATWAKEDQIYGELSSIQSGISSGISAGTELSAAGVSPGWSIVGGALVGLSQTVNGIIQADRNYERTIANLEDQKYQHSLVPDSINNGTACAEVLFSRGNYEFKAQLMTITGERAKQIDEYFDRFGYIVNNNANLVQAIKCRNKWNYVKTAECNIKADIPDEDLSEIKTIFNEGITFWKDASYFYKYNLGSSNT
jgi:hypothetical protein